LIFAASPVSPAQGLSVNTGAGNNTVLQDKVYVSGIIYVITGEGDDTVIATGNFTALPYQAVFDGITGFDRLTLIGNQFPSIFTNNMVIV
jgi:hypothetical protein